MSEKNEIKIYHDTDVFQIVAMVNKVLGGQGLVLVDTTPDEDNITYLRFELKRDADV